MPTLMSGYDSHQSGRCERARVCGQFWLTRPAPPVRNSSPGIDPLLWAWDRPPECPIASRRCFAAARCSGSGKPAGDPSRFRRISPRATALRYRGPEVQAWRKRRISAGLNSGLNSSQSLGPIPIASGTGGYLKVSGKVSNSRSESVFTRLRRRTVLWRALLGADAGFRKTGAVKVFANRRSPVFFLSAIVPRQGQLCQTCLPLSTTIKISTTQPAIRAQLEREGTHERLSLNIPTASSQ
jgi:hypothetical protein